MQIAVVRDPSRIPRGKSRRLAQTLSTGQQTRGNKTDQPRQFARAVGRNAWNDSPVLAQAALGYCFQAPIKP